jgi:D-alanyl-D-alanine carboxypeptidase
MQNDTFREIVNTKEYTIPATNKCGARKLATTNKLISTDPDDSKYVYQGAIGIKTGLTPKAKGCLVAEAVRDNMSLIVCIYNDGDWPNGLKRWAIAKNLFDYGFSDFASVDIAEKLNQVKFQPLTIEGTEIGATPKFDSTFYTGLKDDVSKIATADIVASTSWTKTAFPIKKDDELGTVQYKMGDNVIASAKLVASGDTDAETIATDQPVSSQPASPGDPGYVPAKHIKDTSIVAIVIVIAVLAGGVIMLVVLLTRRHRKNAIYNRNARRRHGRNDYYNYRKRF